jgi:rhodanese-related sulfurtransferase
MKKNAIAVLLSFLTASCATPPATDHVLRISPRDVQEGVEQRGALLVCAYPAEKCPGTHLVGAISLEELEARLPTLSPDQEIILFCGCTREGAAAGRAVEIESRGFRNVGVVSGGLLAWILEGYEVTSTRKEQAR